MRGMKHSYSMPPLTRDMMDEIVFSMEDQRGIFSFDLKEGHPVSPDSEGYDKDDMGRYIDIPSWSSADGFRLMERFTSRVRSDYWRGQLSQALESGKGVFRSFKDVLSKQKPLLAAWYDYKDHEMEKAVTSWYREHQGILSLEEDDEEEGSEGEGLGDLLLEDFSIEWGEPSRGVGLLSSLLPELSPVTRTYVKRDMEDEKAVKTLYAVGVDGELCGMMAYKEEGEMASLVFYGVAIRWRGFGLFRLMFDSLARQLRRQGLKALHVGFGGKDSGVSSMFESLPMEKEYWLSRIDLDGYADSADNSEQAFV